MYDGDVLLRSSLLAANKVQALHLIHHEADRARRLNPLCRLASLEDRGEEIAILTTCVALAERIGKSFQQSFKGKLVLQHLPDEQFVRVRWCR